VDVSLPTCCPDCGGHVELVRSAEQFQVDLPQVRPVKTKFNIGVGRCKGCGRRVQGRHVEQTSDALGVASSQVGSTAKGMGGMAALRAGLELSEDVQPASPPRDQPHRRGAQANGSGELPRPRPDAGQDRGRREQLGDGRSGQEGLARQR